MFIVTLLTIARTWKQCRCPSTDEWIKKFVVHIHNGILLNHKREYILVHSNEVDEHIIHSEVSQKEKDKYCILTHIYGI